MSWLVDSLCECIGALAKGRQVVLFGNSLGGFVALRAALQAPEQVAALVLASPAGAPVTPQQLEGLKTFFQLQTHESGLEFMSRVVAFPERIPGPLRHIMAWACRAR
jgi:pimeloyl-ACP methyl ester carboxylesterase